MASATAPPPAGSRGLQDVPVLTAPSPEAALLASVVMRGQVTVAKGLEQVAQHFAAHPRVDGMAAALTTYAPEESLGWVSLGQRAWLREWMRPGSPCHLVPDEDPGPEKAFTMPWMSQHARRDVAAIPDAEALPPEAQQDRLELAACGVRSLLSRAQHAEGVMYGSISVVSSQTGLWPETLVADLRLLSAALTARMGAEQAKRSLADAIALGDQAHTSQQHFFSTIGHEMRTPIAAIVGFAEMLAEDARDRGDPETLSEAHERFAATVERDCGVILRAGEQLLAIVEDLLATGRVLGAEEVREQVNVSAAIEDIIHWHRTPALAGGITVTSVIPADFQVQARPSGLRQVLTNLVGNAIVHNRPGGSVTISASESAGEGGEPRLRIAVRDTGPGLEPGQLSRVFESFVRFAGDDVDGTGLGLSLARAVAEREGGVVGAESVPGVGSVFWVDLPAR